MKSASSRVLISVYKLQSLAEVLSAYEHAGEKGDVNEDTLRLENGLIYKVVPSARLKRIFEGWKLKVHEHPFGLVYDFTS